MKFDIDSDFVITPSEEAEICLSCDKPKCNAHYCTRIKEKLQEIKNREKAEEIKEEFEIPEVGSFSWNK